MNEVKERISISKFVEGYKKIANENLKDKYIQEHIKNTYAPILQKKLILEMMNSKSVVETPVKHIDMTVSKLNVVMAILVLYTDIEPDKQTNENGTTTPLTWEAYDALKSSGLYGILLDAIGEDLNELMSVQEQILESWHIANTSIEAYISNLMEVASRKFGVYIGVGLEKIAEALDDETKMQRVMKLLEKAFKK